MLVRKKDGSYRETVKEEAPKASGEQCSSGTEQWMLGARRAGERAQSQRLPRPLERDCGQTPFGGGAT